jgi:hypothetical protein
VQRVFADEFARRNADFAEAIRAGLSAPFGRQVADRWPAFRELFDQRVAQVYAWSRLAAGVFPALLALESLAASVLAWSLYHRLSRTRLGPAPTPLRDFRFSDQLVWGFVAGLVIVLLPELKALRLVGANLLLFFGALYAARGFGIIVWSVARLLRRRRAAATLAIAGLIVLSWATVVPALGLGLMDTWIDWRGRTRPTS